MMPALPLPVTAASLSESPPAHSALPQNPNPYLHAGWLVILLGVLGFFIWAALAPLDTGVPVPGRLIVEGQRKSLHHPTGGQIETILVHEGSEVSTGQLLIQLNATQALAEVESLRLQLDSARALWVRLQAERDGQPQPAFPAGLSGEARINQQALFDSRQQSLRHALTTLDEVIAGYTAQLEGLEAALEHRAIQRQALHEQLQGYRRLVDRGHVSKNQVLEMERLYAQVNADIAENLGAIGQLQRQIQELRLRKETRRQEFMQEVHTHLAETELRVQALTEYQRAAAYTLEQTRVLAPASGQVIGLKIFTEGGFINPGTHLLDLVPSGKSLLVEAQVPVHLIDQLHPGLPVLLTLSAFNQNTTPKVAATLEMVAGDRLVDAQTGQPYYPVLARVDAQQAQQQPDLLLRPGMPVELLIKTGERTLLSYLFKPLQDRARTALVER